MRLRGQVVIESAEGESKSFNALTSTMLAAVASLLAESAGVPAPQAIALGTGATAAYAASNQDADHVLTSAGSGQELAQGFIPEATRDITYALLYLKRLGSSAGDLTVEIQTDSGGSPSGTPVADGVSDAISINALSATGYAWVRFPFSTQPEVTGAVQYHLVLKSTGYTFDGGVTEVIVGVDESSPSYADGSLQSYDGAAWGAASPAADAIFRVVAQTTGAFTSVLGEFDRNAITSRTIQGSVTARLLAHFSQNEAQDYIGHVGLYTATSGGSLMAIATTQFDKSGVLAVNVYWLITAEVGS
jgi:hypothetical protein